MIKKASIILVDAFLMGKRMKWEGSIYLFVSRLFSKGCLKNRKEQIQALLFVVSGF